MRLIRYITLCVFFSGVIGCASKNVTIPEEEDIPHVLDVSEKTFDIPGDNKEYSFTVTTNDRFIIRSQDAWIKLSEPSGSAPDYVIRFTVEHNGADEKREGTILVATDYKSIELRITQGNYPSLAVLDKEIRVAEDKTEIELLLLHPVEVGFTTSAEWLVFKGKQPENTYVFTVEENSTYDERLGYIYISSRVDSQKDTVKVIQFQKNALILSSKEIEFSEKGGIASVVLKSNIAFHYQTSAPNWIIETDNANTKALTDNVISFNVLENSTRFDRTGDVYFYNHEYNLSDTFTVLQQGYESVLQIHYSGTDFDLLSLKGESMYGSISWGDNQTDEVTENPRHHYAAAGEKIIEIKSHNSTGMALSNITNISTIDLSRF